MKVRKSQSSLLNLPQNERGNKKRLTTGPQNIFFSFRLLSFFDICFEIFWPVIHGKKLLNNYINQGFLLCQYGSSNITSNTSNNCWFSVCSFFSVIWNKCNYFLNIISLETPVFMFLLLRLFETFYVIITDGSINDIVENLS